MSAWSDFAENALIDWFFRQQAFSVAGAACGPGSGPFVLFVGVFLENPTDALAGVEPTGSNYARVPIVSGLTTWDNTQHDGTTALSSGTSGSTRNNDSIFFAAAGASDWGELVGAGLFDSLEDGNLVAWTVLTTPKFAYAYDEVMFPAHTLEFRLDT